MKIESIKALVEKFVLFLKTQIAAYRLKNKGFLAENSVKSSKEIKGAIEDRTMNAGRRRMFAQWGAGFLLANISETATSGAIDPLEKTNSVVGGADGIERAQAIVLESRIESLDTKINNMGVVSVKDFGAVGDYNPITGIGTDDSQAFFKAIKFVMSTPNYSGTLTIPIGNYLVTDNNFLGNPAFFTELPFREYFHLAGAGFRSIIYWKPSGGAADYWMYDCSLANTNALITPQYSDLHFKFESDNVPVGSTLNGWKMTGLYVYPVQCPKFQCVKVVGELYSHPMNMQKVNKMGVLFYVAGTVNADAISAVNCSFMGLKTILNLDSNDEAVVYDFVSCNCIPVYGDVFKVSAGSSITVLGGSWVMMSQEISYFMNVTTKTKSIGGTFTFNGFRLEQSCPDPLTVSSKIYSRILNIDATSISASVFPGSLNFVMNFDSCNFNPHQWSDQNSIRIDAATAATINFTGCKFNSANVIGVKIFTSIPNVQSLVSWHGTLTKLNFTNGQSVLPAHISFATEDAAAKVSSINCTNTLDYDLSPASYQGGKVCTNIRLKTAKVYGSQWPDSGGNGSYVMKVTLPAGALIKAIRFRKIAGGSSVAKYQLFATDSNATVVYCRSVMAAQNLEHKAFVDNLNIYCSSPKNSTVFIWASPVYPGIAQATKMNSGDYVMVDYY